MRRVRVLTLGLAAVATFALGATIATDKLPAGFESLIPNRYRLVSPGCTNYGGMVGITFVAAKEFTGHHFHFNSEYNVDLFFYQTPEGLMAMLAKPYQTQLTQDIESTRRSFNDRTSDALTGYDTPKETQYAWGWGITQRTSHRYMGAGTAPDDIEYVCQYFGLTLSDTTVKRFKLSVNGVSIPSDADRWAATVAEKVAKTGVADIQQ